MHVLILSAVPTLSVSEVAGKKMHILKGTFGKKPFNDETFSVSKVGWMFETFYHSDPDVPEPEAALSSQWRPDVTFDL